MDISYAINERYVEYCLVSMVSLLENNIGNEINFHILTDHLSASSKIRIQNVIANFDCNIHFYEIPDSWIQGLSLNCWSKYCWYRLFLPQLISSDVSRILYLDTDTIITGSITELFNLNLSDHSIAGCLDIMSFSEGIFDRLGYPSKFGYVCSGVLLLNLDYFRVHDLTTKIIDFAKTHSEIINFPDQDAINYICHSSTYHLPLKYDILAPFLADKDFYCRHSAEVVEILKDPRIIHYAGCNPWKKEIQKHYYHDVFWKYANKIGGIHPVSVYSPKVKVIITIKKTLAYLGFSKFKYLLRNLNTDFSHLSDL